MVVDEEQVVRVHARVLQHLSRERADAPVRGLVSLVGNDVAIHLEELREAVPREVEHLGSVVRVEEVDDVEIEVPLKPNDVRLRTMENL